MMKYISVAIDGPSGAGKSTVARAAAAKLGYVYVDTGAMYRSIGLAVCRRGIAGEDTAGIIATLPEIAIQLTYQDGAQHVLLNGEDVSEAIRTPEIFVLRVQGVRGAGSTPVSAGNPAQYGEKQQHPDGRPRHRHGHPAGCAGQDFPDRVCTVPRGAPL